MRKKIRFYRQHTLETCGPSCVLMILDFYQKIKYPTEQMEHKIYESYRSRTFCGMTGAAIAKCLAKNGFHILLKHSSSTMLENKNDYFSEELFQSFLKEYKTTLANCTENVDVLNGVEISCETIRNDLDAGRQIILECIIPGNADGIHEESLHWILIYGYEHDSFLICDPLSSKIRLNTEEMKKYMDTPIGKICIVIEVK